MGKKTIEMDVYLRYNFFQPTLVSTTESSSCIYFMKYWHVPPSVHLSVPEKRNIYLDPTFGSLSGSQYDGLNVHEPCVCVIRMNRPDTPVSIKTGKKIKYSHKNNYHSLYLNSLLNLI